MLQQDYFSTNALMLASGVVLACGLSLHADVHVITQDGMSFIPNEIKAAPGDTLQFVWGDGGHTVTSGFDCTAGSIDGFSFDEPLDDANTLVVIEIPLTFSGDLGYLCDIYTHCESGDMHGVVHVAAAAPESPSAYTTEWRMDGMTGDDLASDLGNSTITPTGMVVDVDYSLSDTTAAGLPSLADGDAGVLVMNGGASPNTGLMTMLNVPANDGFTADIGEFTFIFDLYIPAGEGGNYVGMWNGNAMNDNDADTFLYKPSNNFWSAGAGVVGDADSWAFDGWFRFVQRVDYSENTADIYVNGVHVVTTVAPDWLYNSVSGNPVWMLADNNGETQLMYCANMAIVDAYMSEADISALGGPMAAGIFSGNPVAGTGASYDASCNCTVRTAWESNSNGELYMGDDTTCVDTPCPLPSNNTCTGAIMITESVTLFDSSDASTSDFVYDWASCSGSYPGAMGKDVWHYFTPTEDGVATVSTCDTASYDTTIAVLEGEACESLLMAACNGDASGGKCQNYYSQVDVPVTAGSLYWVAVGGYSSGGSGPGTITITGVGIDDGSVDCPADFGGDGVVDGADIGLLLAAWGSCPGCPEDLNGDGEVNGADIGLLLAAFGKCN